MSLARVWRRQLFGASSVALIVPSAMLAALVVLALGGGLSQVGVLGQIFAGPSLPAAGPLGLEHSGPVGSAGGLPGTLLPVVPAVAPAARSSRSAGSVAPRSRSPRTVVSVSGGAGKTGGAISPTGGGTVRPVTQGTGGGSAGTGGSSAGPPSSSSPQPSPAPQPAPRPTPVDTAVKVVTSVTQQVPGPAGLVATQAVQAAGAAADNLLAVTGAPAPGGPAPGQPAPGLTAPVLSVP